MELMVTVVIIGVLAAIAYPSYQNYARKARRSDAHSALLAMANAEEKFFLSNNQYAANPGQLNRQLTGAVYLTDLGYYTLTLAAPVSSATVFSIVATAVPGGPQGNDTDCTVMSINHANQKTPANCWQ